MGTGEVLGLVLFASLDSPNHSPAHSEMPSMDHCTTYWGGKLHPAFAGGDSSAPPGMERLGMGSSWWMCQVPPDPSPAEAGLLPGMLQGWYMGV